MPHHLDFASREPFENEYAHDVINHLMGLGMALKKARCVKLYRNYRTTLALAHVFEAPGCSWLCKSEAFDTNVDYNYNEVKTFLAKLYREIDKHKNVLLKQAIQGYAGSIQGTLYDVFWRSKQSYFSGVYGGYLDDLAEQARGIDLIPV